MLHLQEGMRIAPSPTESGLLKPLVHQNQYIDEYGSQTTVLWEITSRDLLN